MSDHSLALSLFALPKSGSTFLGHFLKALSVYARVCKLHELQRRCTAFASVGCPPESGLGAQPKKCASTSSLLLQRSRRCTSSRVASSAHE